MSSAALIVVFAISLQTVLSAPVIDGQIATRDHSKAIAPPQVEFNLEAELKDRTRPHKISVGGPRLPSINLDPQGINSDAGSSAEVEESGKQYPVGSLEQYHPGSSKDLTSEESIEVEEDVKNPKSILNKLENKDQPTDAVKKLKAVGISKDESRDNVDSSEEEDSVISEEEEDILRTIIITLKDNPELIKVLLESDVEDLEDDDFSKQKAQVSGPESWGTFESSEHQMPKQMDKKWGEGLLSGNEENKVLKNDGVIQLPVKPEGRLYPDDDEMKADISGLDLLEELSLSSEKPFSEENKEESSHTKQSTEEESVGSKVEENPEDITPDLVPNKEETAAGSVDLVENGLLEDGFVDSGTPQSYHVNEVDSGPGKQEEQTFVEPSREDPNENVHHSSYNVLKIKPEQTEETELQALSQLRGHPLAGLEEGGGVNPHM